VARIPSTLAGCLSATKIGPRPWGLRFHRRFRHAALRAGGRESGGQRSRQRHRFPTPDLLRRGLSASPRSWQDAPGLRHRARADPARLTRPVHRHLRACPAPAGRQARATPRARARHPRWLRRRRVRRHRLRPAEPRRDGGPVHLPGRALRAPLRDQVASGRGVGGEWSDRV
jgi:hypothetical protein